MLEGPTLWGFQQINEALKMNADTYLALTPGSLTKYRRICHLEEKRIVIVT